MDDTPTNTPTNTSSTGSNDWASVMDIDSSNLGYMFVVGEGLQQRAFNIEGLTVSANDQLVINNIPVRAAADLVIARGVVRGFMREHGGEWHLVDTFDQSVGLAFRTDGSTLQIRIVWQGSDLQTSSTGSTMSTDGQGEPDTQGSSVNDSGSIRETSDQKCLTFIFQVLGSGGALYPWP